MADLRRVETQIQNVKERSVISPGSSAATAVSAGPGEYFVPVDISSQKIGDLVESMPL